MVGSLCDGAPFVVYVGHLQYTEWKRGVILVGNCDASCNFIDDMHFDYVIWGVDLYICLHVSITSVLFYTLYLHFTFYILIYCIKRLRWSRGSVLIFSTQVRGFKPGRSRRIFRAKKSSALLPSVPCRRFTACKRSLNLHGSRDLGKITGQFLAHSSTFRC